MRHRKAGLKLNRTSSHRNAMFRNMVTSLFKHERIRTTDVKAKELRRWADNLITLAKRGDVHARRQALSIVREKDVVHKLFAEAAERYQFRPGGYTRVVKLGRRPGDQAPISLIELIFSEDEKKKKPKKKKKAKAPRGEKKVDKTKEIQDVTQAEESTVPDEGVETKKAGTEVKSAAETTREVTNIEQEKTEDKAAAVESETSDSDETSKKEASAQVETGDADKPETAAKEAEEKKADTEPEA